MRLLGQITLLVKPDKALYRVYASMRECICLLFAIPPFFYYHSSFIFHLSSFMIYLLLFVVYRLPFIVHCSFFIVHFSLFIVLYSGLNAPIRIHKQPGLALLFKLQSCAQCRI